MKRVKRGIRRLLTPFVVMPILTALVLSGWIYSQTNPIWAQDKKVQPVKVAPKPKPVNWGPELLVDSTWAFEQTYALTALSGSTNGLYTVDIPEDSLFGQGGWKPVTAISVPSPKQFQFSFTYISNRHTEIGVDYILDDGKPQYKIVKELPPVKKPTKVTVTFQPVKKAATLRPSVQISRAGHLETSNYSLRVAQ